MVSNETACMKDKTNQRIPLRSNNGFLECAYCGRIITHLMNERVDNAYFSFCNKEHKKLFEEAREAERQKAAMLKKFEEIKKFAEKLLVNSMHYNCDEECFINASISSAWNEAKKFYDFVEQKREEEAASEN
jgi:hypothetical protein